MLTFDDFLAIPPCASGSHSVEPPPAAAVTSRAAEPAVSLSNEPVAIEPKTATTVPVSVPPRPPSSSQRSTASARQRSTTPFPLDGAEVVQDPDDSMPVEGAICKRNACGKAYVVGDERSSDECSWHPGGAIFHEGSKVIADHASTSVRSCTLTANSFQGWSCCKPRVLDFGDFMSASCTPRGAEGEGQKRMLKSIKLRHNRVQNRPPFVHRAATCRCS